MIARYLSPHSAGVVAAVLLTLGVAQAQTRTDLADPPLAASELLPLEQRETTFTITDGSAEGERVPHVLAPTRDGEGWALSMQGYNTIYLQRAEDGSILLTAIELEDRGEKIVYEQPVPLLPGSIKAGEVYTASSPVEVRDISSGEVLYSGSAEHSIDLVSRTTFNLPAQGSVKGYMVEINQSVDLPAANIDISLETGFVPQQGPVYRDLKYTVEKLGFFGDTTNRTAVLAEPLRG